MTITALDVAQRFVGLKEVPGVASSYLVMAMLRLDMTWPTDDSVPWCSAFVNFVCWILNIPRSRSLAAASWLDVGKPVAQASDAIPGFDIVVLRRTGGHHVGFFEGVVTVGNAITAVRLCGGNQHDMVNITDFPVSDVLGIRRLAS